MTISSDRRTFLGAAGFGLLVLRSRSGRAVASERVRVAVIGLRSRGHDHARLFSRDSGAEVVAVCDVDDAMFAKPVMTVDSAGGKASRTEKDSRKLLDDKTIDSVTITIWQFPNACLVWEHRMRSKHPTEGASFGIAFYGDKGTMIVGERDWRVQDGDGSRSKPGPDGQGRHVRNFLDCVKTRQKPNADIEIGHLSTRLCHLGNIAYRVGKTLTFDAHREAFHDAEANALLSRQYSSRFEMPSHV
jgi:Oxidoreductase family, C-terminal alpha/beta domain